MSGILYISYDGMLEPLGQSQVLAYLERLAPGYSIHLISFEKAEDWANPQLRAAVEARMRAAGISWHPLRYHKAPSALATAYDIAQGIRVGAALVRRLGLTLIHARSYVPSVMALAIRRLSGARYLFDMRGFWADERVDGGIWPRDGQLYRIAKGLERRFLLAADAVVSLTEAGKREIGNFPYLAGRVPPITVIPTCADLERFKPGAPPPEMPFVLGYVGGAGTWYLFEEALAVFRAVKRLRPDSRLLIVNRNEHDWIRNQLSQANVDAADCDLVAASHAEMPDLMSRMHAGLVLIKPVYSKTASAPTKLAEFLGCGVPCLVNSGVGDMAPVIAESDVGVVMSGFSEQECNEAAVALFSRVAGPGIRQRCALAAHRHFSLEQGVRAYNNLYRSLSGTAAVVPRSGDDPFEFSH
ncbi:MAG: glycosyltransferase [Myxococcota bacterium]|jgi:glycosyltransferase involved in cell wall biosynthesis